jgi:putative zinc finger/helix-turn-helix YgiT family protein
MKTNLQTCPECHHNSLSVRPVSLTGERNGEEFTVIVEGLHCDNCGYKTVNNQQSGEFTKAVSDAYRTKYGLLTGVEIKARRAALSMSQLDFAAYLGAGAASVKRWESGQVQDRAMDSLIRLKTNPEEARGNLQSLESQLGRTEVVYGGVEVDYIFTIHQPWVETTVTDWHQFDLTYHDEGRLEAANVEAEPVAA